jgi:predicted aldo/keto reductase-like oxidoreductase
MKRKNLNRREFLKRAGIVTGGAMAMMAFEPFTSFAKSNDNRVTGENLMTYRTQQGTGEKISLLGFGMMRLPRDNQELVNELVDYAIAHGVNYFDTAPMYGGGLNEGIVGAALSRHPRDKYYVATKMSNYKENFWPLEEAKKMYQNSFEKLRVDYIDYYLLHGVGQGGMEAFENRFINNGLLDFLVKEREAGRIRHLGFSYHGDVRVFDWLIDHHDTYHWDFVQIQMNFLDWRHASLEKGGWKTDADAEYLYNKLAKAGIQAVIMEPFRGGALSKMSPELVDQLKAMRPNDTVAQWAFRWVSSHPNILTTLSGMNVMEHLVENVATHSPLEPCTAAENELLEKIADAMIGIPTVPCTTCAYCMPCPYGVDIPGNFAFYNEAMNNKLLPLPEKSNPEYSTKQKQFTEQYLAHFHAEARANQCMDCEECLKKCPQGIRIPNQLSRINDILRGR